MTLQWRNAEHFPHKLLWVTNRSRWHHEQLPKRCFSSASLNPLPMTSIQRRHPRFPMPDVSQLGNYCVRRLRSYSSSARTTPPLSNKDLVYPASVRLPRLVFALVAHVTRPSTQYMETVTTPFPYARWGITSFSSLVYVFRRLGWPRSVPCGIQALSGPWYLLPTRVRPLLSNFQLHLDTISNARVMAMAGGLSLFTPSRGTTTLELGFLTPGIQR